MDHKNSRERKSTSQKNFLAQSLEAKKKIKVENGAKNNFDSPDDYSNKNNYAFEDANDSKRFGPSVCLRIPRRLRISKRHRCQERDFK